MRLQNFWWLLIWPLLFGILSRIIYMKREELVDGQYSIRWRPLPAVVLAVPFVIWAGWRRWFGDTEVYRGTFLNMPSSLDQIGTYMKSVRKGYGFKLFELLFKCLISRSDIALFVCIAAIQMVCLVTIYRKYSTNYWLSFFFFIASTDYLSWMFNGIRQFIAAAILFTCVPLIAKKRYLSVIIIVLLVSQIHATALIFLPFIFIVTGKFWNPRTMLFIVGIIIAVLFADSITGFLVTALEETAYEGDIDILKSNDGTNILRVLFYSIPAIMASVYRRYLDQANDPFINVCANLSIVTAGFYVFSFFTSGILMGSIPIYFSLSNYILIPWLLREVFSHNRFRFFEMVFVVVYSLFFYIQCGPVWGLL